MTIAAERGGSAGLVVRVLVPLGAAFLLSNFFRSLNAVLSPYLIADRHLTARSLGLITSVYFFTSAVFQAPLGLFMDRYGPRRVQGALIRSQAPSYPVVAYQAAFGAVLLVEFVSWLWFLLPARAPRAAEPAR